MDPCTTHVPRIAGQNGRLFCGRCRHYLDLKPENVPGPSGDLDKEKTINDVASEPQVNTAVLDADTEGNVS